MSGTNYQDCRDCLDRLANAVGSREGAINLMSDALLGEEVGAIGYDDNGRLSSVPARFWQRAKNDPMAIWSWTAGSFSTVSSIDDLLSSGGEACAFKRVQFDMDKIDKLAGGRMFVQSVLPKPATRGGGNPGKIEPWHRFWLAAMTLLDNGDLHDVARFPTQAALRKHLLEAIDDDLSDESIRHQVRQIWQQFRER